MPKRRVEAMTATDTKIGVPILPKDLPRMSATMICPIASPMPFHPRAAAAPT
jgi:hypothetical protein